MQILIIKDSATTVPKEVRDIAEAKQYQEIGFSVTVVTEDGNIPLEQHPDYAGSDDQSGGEGTGKPSDGLTTAQIKAALDAKGIAYDSKAKKSELAALLDAE